jgi:hypothetical protein
MLKKLATALVVLAVVAGSVFGEAKNGGIARQIAMGGSNAGAGLVLNPFIMDDPAVLLLNPAYQAMYKDYAWMNVGGGTLNNLSSGNNGYGQQNAGLAFSFGREWSFGAVLSYDPSAVNAVGTLLAGAASPAPGVPALPAFVRRAGGAQAIPAVANVWEVVAAYDMGSLDVGFGFMYGNSNTDSKTVPPTVPAGGITRETEASSSVMGFRLGMNFDLGSGSSVDAAGSIRLDKATDNVTITPTPGGPTDGNYSASGTEIQFNLRGKFKMSNKVNFVPYGTISIVSAEPKEDKAPNTLTSATLGSEKVSTLAYAVGAGAEYRTPSFYLAGGISVQSARAKFEFTPPAPGTTATLTGTYFALPVVNIGGEWWFTDWLAGRAGYFRSMGKTKNSSEGATGAGSSTETNTSGPNSLLAIGGITNANNDGLVTLGLGMRFGGFALDATVSEEALRRGFGLIGAQDNINTFGYITTSYYFGD